MLGTMPSASACSSDTSLPRYQSPATPPYTPAKSKRKFERSDSPALSIHPTETVSPPKKSIEPTAPDNVIVEELTDTELGYLSDTNIIYPQELEEEPSRSDDEAQGLSSSDYDSDVQYDNSGIAIRFANLNCGRVEQEEAQMQTERRARKLNRRAGSRIFKRPHSETVKNVAGVSDPLEALDDQDTVAGIRRQRRRTKGPDDMTHVYEDGKPPEAVKPALDNVKSEFEPADANGLSDDGPGAQMEQRNAMAVV